ncbi:hypothetical protein BDV28DRAFT_95311 [Aspergillus coremiiformis]|uniref:Uncharacterized protein n=1 Tax=Aspergillus coremiiformis TaxID=138285 RepID=A0A5N6ZHA9_9EURO|nr:hypothetical protein BDV28DRAFT_95311 [Aspergillus coremiiformis]
MPPFSTPFRRPSSRRPQSSARQFASTPRFVLSQQTLESAAQLNDDLIDAEDSPQSTPVATARVTKTERDIGSAQPRQELIEDFDGPAYDGEAHQTSPDNTIHNLNSDSSPSGDASELDAEFEVLFGPTTSRAKRRRASLDPETPFTQRRKHDDDIIHTSSPEGPSPTRDRIQQQNHVPVQGRPKPPPEQTDTTTITTPRPSSTPGSIKNPFRHNPRFLLSSQAFPNTQPQSSARPPPFATPAPTSSIRKPTFVLPRSPSPSHTADDPSAIPTPFSPSHTSRRRGRSRSSAPSYLPGGMAAEVRSWILEMGTKREQAQMNRGSSGPDLQKYFIAVRITDVRQSALASSGPLAFVRGRSVTALDDDNHDTGFPDDPETKNLLLLGPPRAFPAESKSQDSDAGHVPGLAGGDVVGVYRGLVWELDLADRVSEHDVEGTEIGPDSAGPENSVTRKWLVGVEWDLVSTNL